MSLSPGTRLGPYEIEGELGRGGMGEVYRARDTRLDRQVAVKILPSAFAADPESVRRFEKEARAVASLSHPNIVTLLDVGEQDGVRYAVAELVAGETLRARLSGGPLPTREAVEVAAQIAEGLEAAHEKGIVHRDIKPDNVVITPSGFARILDFGLAKRGGPAIGAVAEDDATQSALGTEPGVIAGTVGYMSPEQVRGEEVDGRSDVFSLGVVLWEMLTGRRPFRGESQIETLNAILKEEPPPDPSVAALPSELDRILRRCLEKRRENRYHSAADLAHDLKASVSSPRIAALPVTARTAAPRSRLVPALVLFVGVAVAAVLLVLLRPGSSTPDRLPRTLAVLPFRPIGSEGTAEHFGLGLADSLIGRLAAVRDLTVRPTSAIARYEAAPADAGAVGRALSVDAVLEGTYQKVEGTTRVSVQMTDVSRQALLWSDRIELAEGKLFQLQDTIARSIVEKLRLELGPSEKRALGASQPVPDRVTEKYLAVRARLPRIVVSDLEKKREMVSDLDEVVNEAPDFAPAIGARAYAKAFVNFFSPSPEGYRGALADADRALALSSALAEPRVARASLYWSSSGGWNVVAAVKELKAAIATAPNLELAHLDLTRIYQHYGWTPEARAEIEVGRRIFPSSPDLLHLEALVLSRLTPDKRPALEMYRRLPEEIQRTLQFQWQTLSIRLGFEDPRAVLPEVEAVWRKAPKEDPVFTALLAVARARAGRNDSQELERLALSADSRVGHFHHVYHFLAELRAQRRDAAGAADYLRRASETGLSCPACFDNDPLLDPIRGSRDYQAVKEEIERRNAGYRASLKGVL